MFQRKEPDSTSTLLKLSGRPLGYVRSLKTKYEKATGRELHKGAAVAMILNALPKAAAEQAIRSIIRGVEKKK